LTFNTFNTSGAPEAYSARRAPDSLLVAVEPTGGDPIMASANVSVGLGYDTIAAPLDACCGVFDQLARLDGPVAPMAQLGDSMLFMVRSGSAALARRSLPAGWAALGLERRDGADQLDSAVPDSTLWVVPRPNHSADLPPASTVVAAIRAAHEAMRRTAGAP